MKKCYLSNLHSILTNPLSFGRKISSLALLVAVLSSPFAANANVNSLSEDNSAVAVQKSVTGTVTEESGMSLPGVSVVVKGTTVGTVTDVDGKYEIAADESGVLVFSFVGMTTQEITVGSQTVIDVVMAADALQVDEVVVTALGIKREKKALGYAVQDVKADELTQTGNSDLVSSLQGKVAGVQISQSGGGVGGTSRIDIRGSSSLLGNDEPLWVVDGVPFSNGSGRDGSVWGGTSRAGGAFDLNPEDIESVSILKGPNAAALYGERGGNGVVLVTTKKGTRGKGLGITYSGGYTISEAAYMLDLQDKYGQGNNGVYDKNATASWGPEMTGQMLESWTGETIPYELQKDRLKDFTRTGTNQKHSLAFTGGNDKGTYRVSLGKDILNGIYEDHKVEKVTFDLRADYDINNWLNVDAKVSFFNTKGKERPEIGNYSYVSYFNTMPMNIRNQDLAPGYEILGGQHVEKLYTTANANYRNPYFLQAQTTNKDERNRTFGYIAANVKITSDLKAKFKYGMDSYSFEALEGYLFADNVDSSRPNYNPLQSNFKEENYEFLLSYNKDLNEDFTIGLNFGANSMKSRMKQLSSTSGRLTSENDFFLGAGSNIQSAESITEKEVRSVYGFGQVGYKNMLFLDFTARNDWSSTLTSQTVDMDNSYFYPSVSLSALVSEMVDLPDWVSFAKVRTSWARLGKATDPHLAAGQAFNIGSWNYNLSTGNVPYQGVQDGLDPELSDSYEIGFDLRMFQNRLGVDFTYYNEKTKNQIGYLEAVQSTGYSEVLSNIGEVLNKGFEVMVSTVPVKTNDLTVGLDFNFAKNKGTLEKLAGSVPRVPHGMGVYSYLNQDLGQIVGSIYARNENGDIIIDENGLMTTEQGDDHVIGNLQPDWTGSINLSVDYKGLYMSALVSIQEGGDILSSSERSAVSAGTAERTLENDRMAFFVDGVAMDGGPNNVIISAEEYWRQLSKVDEEFIYDASHMKLKELAIGYNIPKSILSKIPHNPIKSARVSVVGRNLFYFYKDTPGTAPDASAYSTDYAAQAYDFSPVPATRTYGFSLNVGF
ncbi:SusC/RagA family TonB-linked outer membrane protein [Marinifilum caeruleilacunae]|uniref:SusC/RagA family TonB-linked outer membrane protein n=1 Tax=Marinifilum caeruleilacunae TaxID=2499076 RepID=A0ABX1WXL1_9BACT|nr:SusC/RagA family TonB-linked outer membrane protein [Marinifilum caeruleilacunae]NOU60782.1 SusC/RagA family TonB-linked outer membrane protein [Marinifilum caeruleilacunae]